MKALVVGGAGITGTVIVRQLLQRDYEVTILHRGLHEPDLPEKVKRIHADPFSRDSLQSALADQFFDLVIATYGRLKYIAESLIGKTQRLISVGGAAPIYKGWGEMTSINPWETTQPTPLYLAEDHPLATAEDVDKFSSAVRYTENAVMQMHQAGHFNVTHFRYPLVYGPNNICPAEWGIIRRVRDNRKTLILPGGGLTLVSRGFAENVAHGVMLAVDQPQASAGEIYNICDNQVLYNLQWVKKLCDLMQHEFELIDVPFSFLPEGFRATPPQLLYRHHCVMDISKIKQQLGYQDIVSVDEALERTVKWYSDNPLQPESESEQNLGDPFDYAYEDAFIEAYRSHATSLTAQINALPSIKVVWRHPYQQTKESTGKGEKS